jgi:hypothetical protein
MVGFGRHYALEFIGLKSHEKMNTFPAITATA